VDALIPPPRTSGWFEMSATHEDLLRAARRIAANADRSTNPDLWLTTFTIITSNATDDVGHIHDH
jgi:putative SOS response-associated peptidase YedK